MDNSPIFFPVAHFFQFFFCQALNNDVCIVTRPAPFFVNCIPLLFKKFGICDVHPDHIFFASVKCCGRIRSKTFPHNINNVLTSCKMNHAVFADQIDLFICECVGRIMGRPCDYVVNGKSKKKKSYENNSNEINVLHNSTS